VTRGSAKSYPRTHHGKGPAMREALFSSGEGCAATTRSRRHLSFCTRMGLNGRILPFREGRPADLESVPVTQQQRINSQPRRTITAADFPAMFRLAAPCGAGWPGRAFGFTCGCAWGTRRAVPLPTVGNAISTSRASPAMLARPGLFGFRGTLSGPWGNNMRGRAAPPVPPFRAPPQTSSPRYRRSESGSRERR